MMTFLANICTVYCCNTIIAISLLGEKKKKRGGRKNKEKSIKYGKRKNDLFTITIA